MTDFPFALVAAVVIASVRILVNSGDIVVVVVVV